MVPPNSPGYPSWYPVLVTILVLAGIVSLCIWMVNNWPG